MSAPSLQPARVVLTAQEREALRRRHRAVFEPGLVRRATPVLVVGTLAGLLVAGFWTLGVSPERILAGLGNLGSFLWLMVPPDYGTPRQLATWAHALAETAAIAFLGTLLAAMIAFPLGLLAARNTTVNRVVQLLARRMFDTLRGVDELIWALIWVSVVGLGPFAGVLAIATTFIGIFGKLVSEAIEAADRREVEGVLASGGGSSHSILFGIMPQVFPAIAGQVLYFFESNTRSATIIGIVGAGGIGLHLSDLIRTLEWQNVSFIIIMILITVAVIDWISSRLRFALIGTRPPLA